MKLALLLIAIVASTNAQFFGAPSLYHGPQHSHAGIFLPPVRPVSSSNDPSSVAITRFCKAICYLYIETGPTCGTNNVVYENACQARCDRVSSDSTRLKFNNKCCCSNNSDYIDGEFSQVGNFTNDQIISSSNFCVHRTGSTGGLTNVFAIPQCLRECLGIDSMNDLEFINTNYTYSEGCTLNHAV